MNILVLLPIAVLAIPIIPVFFEIFRRKDKGPREVPDQTVYGDSSDDSKKIPPMERTRARARVKIAGEIIRVVGDVSIPSGVEVKENMVVHGDLRLGSRCHIHGSIKAFGEVEVGEESIVEGHIISEGEVRLRRNAKVNGIVDSAENIILEENAVVEAVSTEKSVRIGPGAKINRRISAGISIITTPPPVPVTLGKPTLPAAEEAREVEEAERRAVPSFEAFFGEKRREEVVDEKSRLFESLQDRIRSLEAFRVREIDETKLKDLTLKEVEIYKLIISGRDVSEIGLRLFMDPVQVQEVVKSLIKRRYLDESLKPTMLETAEKAMERTAASARESEAHLGEPAVEELPIDETFEKLLASKLRIGVRKGQKSVEEETGTKARDSDGNSTAKTEMEEILKEWRRASSALFTGEKTGKENPSDSTKDPEQSNEDNRTLSETEKDCAEEKQIGSADKPLHRKYLKASLPFLTILAILLLEVAYYSPSLPLFNVFHGVPPPNFKMWMLFLGLALAFAVATSLYFAKKFSSSKPESD